MIKPTIGRVMWFWPPLRARRDQPHPCIICKVIDDQTVNLVVFNEIGTPSGEQDIPIVENPDDENGRCCQWMPYQKAVAKGEIAPTLHAGPKE